MSLISSKIELYCISSNLRRHKLYDALSFYDCEDIIQYHLLLQSNFSCLLFPSFKSSSLLMVHFLGFITFRDILVLHAHFLIIIRGTDRLLVVCPKAPICFLLTQRVVQRSWHGDLKLPCRLERNFFPKIGAYNSVHPHGVTASQDWIKER